MTLSDLQKKLKKAKFDAFLVSRDNVFIGQDIRDDENLIRHLTGFSGSAGVLLIRPEKSFLFVDGRYELQAPQQVDRAQVEVVCTNKISLADWLKENLAGQKIGYNPWCWSIHDILRFDGVEMKADSEFLPFLLSGHKAKLYEHQKEYCGDVREEKVAKMAKFIQEKHLQAYFISAADSVSWLLNLRSDALPETPVFRAVALVDARCHVWIFTDNVDMKGIGAKLNIFPLSEIPARLKKFKKQVVGCDFGTTATAVMEAAENYNVKLVSVEDFCQEQKAVKNECELRGIRNAHVRDGVAVCRFLFWLKDHWQGKTELDVVKKLHEFRAAQDFFVSESFATIAASGPHGAIVHYAPTTKTNRVLDDNSLLLLDSGGQYYDGTTDITRTIALGTVSPAMSEDFTLVLKAHIALSSAVFPKKTSGARLDALARQVLWREGKNYNHGTGHGVGCFLNVHEGPQYISAACRETFVCGQVTSIEPGYYLENNYGVRIENLAEVVDSPYQDFLMFSPLTLVPIDKNAINKYLLSEEEIKWLDDYHQKVFEKISPFLNSAEKEWLSEACAPL